MEYIKRILGKFGNLGKRQVKDKRFVNVVPCAYYTGTGWIRSMAT